MFFVLDINMQYFYSDKSGFYIDIVHINKIPTDAAKITENQYNEFFEKQSSGKYTWAFDNKSRQFIYNEIVVDNEEIVRQQKITEAKTLLTESDWRVLSDKFKSYSSEKQAAIMDYREQLREVVRGNLVEVPQMPVLLKQ